MCFFKFVHITKIVSSGSDSLDVAKLPTHTGYAFAVAEKEVPWKEQQKRLQEVMPWSENQTGEKDIL